MPNQLQNLLKTFNTRAGFYVFVGRKVSRYAGEFMDAFGEGNLRAIIAKNQMLTDFMDDEKKQHLKMMAMPYLELVNDIEITVVYNWLSPEHKAFLESIKGGKPWALNQLAVIKQFLCSP